MAKDIGEIECTLENCLTDADGSLVVSLRVAKDETYAAKQIVAKIRTGQAARNGSKRRFAGGEKSEASTQTVIFTYL